MRRFSLLACSFVAFSTATEANDSVKIKISALSNAPIIDGDLSDWPSVKEIPEHNLDLTASRLSNEEELAISASWQTSLSVRFGTHNNRLYIAARWQDEHGDDLYRPWKKSGSKFKRARQVDDMFAIRFETSGTYETCMLTGGNYTSDVWHWSAGRSNLAGIADDRSHVFATTPLAEAISYPTANGQVYILKRQDDGESGWDYVRKADPNGDEIQPGVAKTGEPSGSRADVIAKGQWKDGYWTLELSRAFKTDDPEDASFVPGETKTAQIAVFNSGYKMRKKITDALLLQIAK